MKSTFFFQTNAMGMLLALIMPALFPHCHKLKECGSFFIGAPNYPHLIEDSPDRIIECDGQCEGKRCRNLIGYPFGKLSVEIKCPYSPIKNKMLLPVSYKLPHYNGCQVLTHMRAISTNCLLFASCSSESLTVSLVNFQNSSWEKLNFQHLQIKQILCQIFYLISQK